MLSVPHVVIILSKTIFVPEKLTGKNICYSIEMFPLMNDQNKNGFWNGKKNDETTEQKINGR